MRTEPSAVDGVGASRIALPPGPWRTLGEFLVQRFPAVPASEWLARLDGGQVQDPTGAPLAADTPYRPQALVFYYRRLPPELPIPFTEQLLYQDDHLVVVDKPHFLPVTPGGRYLQQTLLVRLKNRLGLDTLTPVHRLDRETAGLVAFCVQPAERDRYHALFRRREVDKEYEAVAPWQPERTWPEVRRSRLATSPHNFMQMCEVDGEPNAETCIRPIAHDEVLAHYRLVPKTGQRHQLRVHMAALGMPIVDDLIYPALQPDLAPGESPRFDRPLQLLARRLSFADPVTGLRHAFESRLRLSAAEFGHHVRHPEGDLP